MSRDTTSTSGRYWGVRNDGEVLEAPQHLPSLKGPRRAGGARRLPRRVTTEFRHDPVLLEETAAQLDLQPGAVVIDGTLGGGGHAARILERIGPRGILIGLDLDPDALAAARTRLSRFENQLLLFQSSFRKLDQVASECGQGAVDAVVLDLGVSSYQLDTPERGFRFSDDAPLDMRMDPTSPESASDLLARATVSELEGWFREYGEVRGAGRLARAIDRARRETRILRTGDLVQLVRDTGVGGGRKHHPATRIFQALRIAVNDELGALREGLEAAVRCLRPGGRMAVIAYHSLEDRIVKNHFREGARGCNCPPRIPVCICGGQVTLKLVTRKALKPDSSEIETNPRARSARLRVAERQEAA